MIQKKENGPGTKSSKITNTGNDKDPLNKKNEDNNMDKEDNDEEDYTILPSNDSGITNDDNAVYDEDESREEV